MPYRQTIKNLSLAVLTLSFSGMVLATDKQEPIFVSDVGFATPESVEYYTAEDVYLVNNINGSPFAEDDNGFISKLAPDGSVIELKWIDGASPDVELNAPKGMTIIGNQLFVADITQIRVFELPSGQQKTSIKIAGSSFLNGMTADKNNTIYVTDTGLKPDFSSSETDAIYKVSTTGKVETVLKDAKMGRPNGIIEDNGQLFVVFFGEAKMLKIDATGNAITMPTPPYTSLDGLVKLKDGSFAMSSWESSAIHTFKNGQYHTLIDNLDAPADMDIDSKRNRLLVPLFKENEVVIIPL